MYIKSVEIKNIKSVLDFRMDFAEPAGWHVLIGDNGAGKSTILKAISATILGSGLTQGIISLDWNEMLNNKSEKGSCKLEIKHHPLSNVIQKSNSDFQDVISFHLERKNDIVEIKDKPTRNSKINFESEYGFSIAFGPFRRFTGNTKQSEKISKSRPQLSAHYSLFDDEASFSSALDWIKEIDRRRLKENEEIKNNSLQEPKAKYSRKSEDLFNDLKKFINQSGLLPQNATFDKVDLDGDLLFIDGNGYAVKVGQLSDGFRSILSLAFELLRQLVRVYGESKVFNQNFIQNNTIDSAGVVLIDEIDSHLHPGWQTKIGDWFTGFFPNMQFIVTTHSPLICRASHKGSIWRMASPGSELESSEITGIEKERIIHGNILDAYGTEVFGKNTTRSVQSNEKLERLGRLNMLNALGKLSIKEKSERSELQKILTTDDPTGK